MPDAVIVSACRTAIGTARKGSLSETDAFVLARAVLEESLQRSGLPSSEIDDLILAESLYGGGVIARYAAVEAGLTTVPGLADNRHCASGLSAIQIASGSIMAGMDRAVIAGGVQSSSTAPMGRRRVSGTDEWEDPWMSPSHPDTPEAPAMDMSITVGWNTAQEAGVSREEMDHWAFDSHRKAVEAIDEGRFRDEIVPLKVTLRDGSRPSSTPTSILAATPPWRSWPTSSPYTPRSPASRSPPVTRRASTTRRPRWCSPRTSLPTTTDLDPSRPRALVGLGRGGAGRTGLAPTIAIPKALGRAGLEVGDVALFEINEAFASMCVATTRILGIDPTTVNVSGSGCSLGHPIAATGARMLTTLINDLARRGGGIGVASMCAGGGMGSAIVIEVGA